MNNPKYARVGNKLYKINTDFKVALRCDEVARDENIREEERALAIIYLLYGDEGLSNRDDYEELLKKGLSYLLCGKEANRSDAEEDMDFEQDKSYIKASFYTDYGIPNIYETDMHWWEFVDLMNGLKEDCVLNRVRSIRNYDISQVKDAKTLSQWRKQKEAVALKRKPKKMTKEQEISVDNFLKAIHYMEGGQGDGNSRMG